MHACRTKLMNSALMLGVLAMFVGWGQLAAQEAGKAVATNSNKKGGGSAR
jgi:hypothetical protein